MLEWVSTVFTADSFDNKIVERCCDFFFLSFFFCTFVGWPARPWFKVFRLQKSQKACNLQKSRAYEESKQTCLLCVTSTVSAVHWLRLFCEGRGAASATCLNASHVERRLFSFVNITHLFFTPGDHWPDNFFHTDCHVQVCSSYIETQGRFL